MDGYIVTKEEIEGYEGIEKIHFLNGNARRLNKSLGDLTGLSGFGFHIIEIQPGYESRSYTYIITKMNAFIFLKVRQKQPLERTNIQ